MQFVWLAALIAAGCTKQSETGRWWESPTASSTPSPVILGFVLDPRAVNGGGATQGTITLNAPSAGPTTITVSSDLASAVVPNAVTVPSGATTIAFTISTVPVTADATATITATVAGRSTRSALSLWTIVPNSFWYESAPGEGIGAGGAAHYTEANANVRAVCDESNLYVQVSQLPGDSWNAIFSTPRGTPLRPGTYEFSSGFDLSRPRLSLSGLGRGCQANGQFVIETAELNPSGLVERFVATFAQRCDGSSAVLRGEIRLASPPRGPGGATPSRCLR